MSGSLGRSDLIKNLDVSVYQTPSDKLATVTVSFCNRSELNTFVYLAVSDSNDDEPNNADYLEFKSVVPPYGVLERTGIVVGPDKKIIVKSEKDDTSVSVYGFEDIL